MPPPPHPQMHLTQTDPSERSILGTQPVLRFGGWNSTRQETFLFHLEMRGWEPRAEWLWFPHMEKACLRGQGLIQGTINHGKGRENIDTLSFLISYSHPYYTSHLVFYLSVDRFLPTWIFFTLRGDGQNQREISWCHERELGAYLSELFRRSVSAGEDERMVTVWCDVHSSWHKPVAVSRQAQTYHAQPSPLCLTSRR